LIGKAPCRRSVGAPGTGRSLLRPVPAKFHCQQTRPRGGWRTLPPGTWPQYHGMPRLNRCCQAERAEGSQDDHGPRWETYASARASAQGRAKALSDAPSTTAIDRSEDRQPQASSTLRLVFPCLGTRYAGPDQIWRGSGMVTDRLGDSRADVQEPNHRNQVRIEHKPARGFHNRIPFATCGILKARGQEAGHLNRPVHADRATRSRGRGIRWAWPGLRRDGR